MDHSRCKSGFRHPGDAGNRATWFAPAGRAPLEHLRRQAVLVQDTPLLQAMLDAMPAKVAILNAQRQVVAANRALLGLLGVDASAVIGQRPGELVGCIHCHEGPDGCGTGRHCVTCGAVAAILDSQSHHGQATRECRIQCESPADGGALDLKVTASAVEVDGQQFTVCAIDDVSSRKRLDVLTRIFFHDVLNLAGGIRGYAQFLGEEFAGNPAHDETCAQLATLAEQLIEQIEAQRELGQAEAGDLEVRNAPVRTRAILESLCTLYAQHDVASGRSIELSEAWDGVVITDPRLLARVLGNMLKNALEATDVGGTVVMRGVDRGGSVLFVVENPGVMPEEVQRQIFQRSFSTKGQAGRGIGTHSMKLLGEGYLGGTVAFTSGAPEGTRFSLSLPKSPAPGRPPRLANP